MSRHHRHRIGLLLISLAVIVPLGFYLKLRYHGPAQHWVRDSAGGAFYEVFWCLAFALLLPRAKSACIATAVLIATCVLEFLQLWHPAWLEWLRSFLIGRTILGSSFDWSDFPYYFVGAALGWACLRILDAPSDTPR